MCPFTTAYGVIDKALSTQMEHLTKRFVVSQNEAYMYLGSSTSLHTCKLQHNILMGKSNFKYVSFLLFKCCPHPFLSQPSPEYSYYN